MSLGAAVDVGMKFVGMDMDRQARNADRDAQLQIAEQNRQLQKDFAQHGIRWKADDARAAGIHPLYALGANTTSFSPVSIDGGRATNYAETLGSMGADVSRAINATRSADERVDAFTRTAQGLELEGKKLDNDIKRATLASAAARTSQSRAQVGPAMPGLVPKADDFEDIPRLRGDLGEINTNKRVVNAEDIEKRYGDLAQEAWGIYTAASDWMNHAKSVTNVRHTGKRGDWWDWVPRFRFGRSHTFKERWKGE